MTGLDLLLVAVIVAAGFFVYEYSRWQRRIDDRLERRQVERQLRIINDWCVDAEPYDWAAEWRDFVAELPEVETV